MIDLVMGGQFGSEGKGAFINYLVSRVHLEEVDEDFLFAVIRTGGPNAGHSMKYRGEIFKMRQIPCGWPHPRATLVLGPGSIINMGVLDAEVTMLQRAGVDVRERLLIDEQATVLLQDHIDAEHHRSLNKKLGSTREGIGACRADRVWRSASTAGDHESWLSRFGTVMDTVPWVNYFQSDHRIIIESTQGFGLSLHASKYYPFCTSADITPGQILNDTGLSSRLSHRVIMVLRTYPIRVGGNSGHLMHEVTWPEMQQITNGYIKEPETTTVTGITRRIGRWDMGLVKRAIMVCRPDAIALTFLDYVFPALNETKELDAAAESWVYGLEQELGVPIRWVSVGFGDTIERK